jgi:hypothetical protein
MQVVQPHLFFIFCLLLMISFPLLSTQLHWPVWTFDVCMMGVVLFGMVLPQKFNELLWTIGFVKLSINLFDFFSVTPSHLQIYPYKIALTLFFSLVLISTLIRETAHEDFSYRMLYQCISTYLMLGVFFALFYRLIHLQDSRAFNFSVGEEFSLVYFSFNVLTSVGLGDELPLSLPAKAGTVLESVAGQVYFG